MQFQWSVTGLLFNFVWNYIFGKKNVQVHMEWNLNGNILADQRSVDKWYHATSVTDILQI